MEPRLVVVSGPSGVGKTTVCDLLLQEQDFERVVTATTRPPRGAETPGESYLFLGPEEFDAWVAQGRFLEWAQVHGHRYGTPRQAAVEVLRRGRHALLNIDVQGAFAVRESGFACFLVFLLPPSLETLEERLRGRGTDDEEAIRRRLRAARSEMKRAPEFDLTVLNDDAAAAARRILAALRP